jgi:radical SAM enzyme (TIGR01210 family)
MVIPVFIPHKGCPFDCIYCNQKAISGQIEEMTADKIRNIIETNLSNVKRDAYPEIGFYGGSFTGIDKELQIQYLSIANEYLERGNIKEIRLSTRPDYINEEILKTLKEYNVGTIELGVQSMDDQVLIKSSRGHTAQDVVNASDLIKRAGIRLGIQTMVGLPGSNRSRELETAEKVVELGPQILRIYPTLVIKGTFLEKLYSDGMYKPLELDEAVETCAELLKVYSKNNINVIRIGLQPTDNINENFDVLAGPFHPSFRQLVESKFMLNKIENYLWEYDLLKERDIIIYTGKENISNIVGQRRENVRYLEKKYNFDKIRIRCKEGLKKEIFVKEVIKE